MEKNSVVQAVKPSEQGVKTSSPLLCPVCGKKMEARGQVFACPVHGTKPYESKGK